MCPDASPWRIAAAHQDPGLDVAPADSVRLRPVAVYPVSGTVVVVFEYLKSRSPFDDAEQRRELLNRLNAVDGVHLP